MLAPGTVLQNRYRIERLIAEGGMGRVYEAVDERIDKTVALKETYSSDEKLRQAFEREAHLLARLEHEALPEVSNHFTEDAGQFLVMQFIPGDDLAVLLCRKGSAFSPGEALPWADQLLDTLDYLHTRQPPIIHRDIKPQNLKLTTRGKVMLLDFGLAKGADSSLPGFTLKYAPIEQINNKGTDARSDLYALAATLYHLMTNEAPVDALTRQEAAANKQPDPLRRADEINPLVPPVIADVLHRAMAVNRQQRYASAAEMCRALRDAVGADQPTIITPAPEPEPLPPALPLRPFVQAAQRTVLLRWLIASLIVLLIISFVWGVLVKGEEKLTLIEYRNGVKANVITSVAFSPDGQTLAASSSNGTINLWNAQTGNLTQSLTWDSQPGAAVTFSPDGQTRIVSVAFSPDGTLAGGSVDKTINLWDAQAGTPRKPLPGHDDSVWAVAFSRDGAMLASGSYDKTIKLWNMQKKTLIRTLAREPEEKHIPRSAIAFSPDGQTLASGSDDNTVLLWDVETGTVQDLKVQELDDTDKYNPSRLVRSVAFSHDGTMLAIGSDDNTIRLWEWDKLNKKTTGQALTLAGHNGSVWAVAFSPDDAMLASGSADSTIRLWSIEKKQASDSDHKIIKVGLKRKPLNGHKNRVGSLAFSPDGQTLASGSFDFTVKLWSVGGLK